MPSKATHAENLVKFGRAIREIYVQTDRQTDRQVIWHDASRSQWQEYAL